MKAAIYIRTSTKEQEPENQLDACLQLNQWGAYDVFKDQQSAWKDNKERDEFNQLLSLIKKGQVSHLIVWDLDRLYRNRLKLVEFFKLCKVYKCTIHSVRQAWLEDITKMPQPWNDIVFDLALNIMGWIGEEESSKKSDRVKKATRKVDGKTLSYKGNKWGRKSISQEKLMRLAELMSSKRNLSVRFIAKELGLSVGTVHKYYTEIQAKINGEKQRLAISQLTNTKDREYWKKRHIEVFEKAFSSEGWVEAVSQSDVLKRKLPPVNREISAKEGGSTDAPQSQAPEVKE